MVQINIKQIATDVKIVKNGMVGKYKHTMSGSFSNSNIVKLEDTPRVAAEFMLGFLVALKKLLLYFCGISTC
jgi:hypothetical protein